MAATSASTFACTVADSTSPLDRSRTAVSMPVTYARSAAMVAPCAVIFALSSSRVDMIFSNMTRMGSGSVQHPSGT